MPSIAAIGSCQASRMDADASQWATSIVLADGESAYLRPISPDDAPKLLAFHERQPRENLYRRFLSPKPTLTTEELEHFTNVDQHDRVALVVEAHGEFVAWASYERWKDRDDAEVAFMVDDAHQGRGIATLLLEHLAAIAQTNGIERFTAETLSDNRPMLRVFSRAGWPVERHFDSGLTELGFPLTDTEQFVDSVEEREHRADSRAVARLLLPKSIAIIGASDKPGSVGLELWRHASAGSTGPVFAVNNRHDTVGGVLAYKSVTDIADDVWLAVIAVPAVELESTIDECIAKKVRGALVISSTEGTDIDMQSLVARARRNGVRLIGPASMGISSPRQSGRMHVALVPQGLKLGNVAISMQSGSLGASVLQIAYQLSMGISWFVSLGDKCDISGNDLLQFWEDDESTRVIALYTESFGNPRKFARIARRVGRTRPIVAVRTGTAAMGQAADALYRHAGLIEVPTVRAMLDTTRVLATQPIPKGPNVAIVTNSRSPGVLARAAVHAAGLTVAESPVELDWRATPDDFTHAIAAAVDDDSIDAIMVIHAPPMATSHAPVDEIEAGALMSTKPVVATMLGRQDGVLREGSSIPSFAFPEPAAAALGRMYAYSHWLRTEAQSLLTPLDRVDRGGAQAVLDEAVDRGDDALSYDDTNRLLSLYGLDTPAGAFTDGATPDEIAALSLTVGLPVVVKSVGRRFGRSARAGIALDLSTEHAVREAVEVIRSALGPDASALVVQQMAPPGVDVRIHCTSDPRFGPVITVGLGSLQVTADPDEASRLPPVSPITAEAMLDASHVGAALEQAGIDNTELLDAIVRVAQLMFDHPDIAELDINPLIVSPGVCLVTDARVVINREQHPELAMRRLV
jgi:acyl-CoA synthetase (NDP forming)/RimJ/RimL family protein N-acetyltransferase